MGGGAALHDGAVSRLLKNDQLAWAHLIKMFTVSNKLALAEKWNMHSFFAFVAFSGL